VSQPEIQPEIPPREGGGKRQDDLHSRPVPLGDWGEPAERLDELYRWVEGRALRTIDWYLADRRRKRLAARLLRLAAAAGATVGFVLPLLELTGTLDDGTGWGLLALLAATACLGYDRLFGVTSGWTRDIATAQALQRRLEVLQFDWTSESVREVLGPVDGTASEAAERCLTVLRRFSEDVSDLIRSETVDWMVEFGAGPAPLLTQTLGLWGHRSEQPAPPAPHFPQPPPGVRPNMPRQRPPEPPR
jgi:hypothetical protein